MSPRNERRPTHREPPRRGLRYWYQETPDGIQDDWSEATSRAVIPYAARDRFRSAHPAVSMKGTRRVEEGLLQWVRIEGRSPGTHELPSQAVEALWRCLRSDEDDWAVFRDSLGIELDAGLDAVTRWIPDDDSELMRATWSDAFDDELPLTGYPTLFILDEEVGFADEATAEGARDPDDPSEQDVPPSPVTFEIYEPAKTDPEPVPERPIWENPSWNGPVRE